MESATVKAPRSAMSTIFMGGSVGGQAPAPTTSSTDQMNGRSRFVLDSSELPTLTRRREADRRRAMDREIKALRTTYLREAEALGEQKLRELERQRNQYISGAVDESAEVFRKLADEKGQVWVELANYIGYPDKNQPPRVKPDWILNQDVVVQLLRKRLAELSAQYDAESATVRAKATREFDFKIAEARANAAIAEDEALVRADREVRDLFKERAGQAAPHLRLGSFVVPPVPSLRSSSTSVDVAVQPVQRSGSAEPQLDPSLRALWKRMSAVRGMEPNPKPLTFEQWRAKFLAGR